MHQPTGMPTDSDSKSSSESKNSTQGWLSRCLPTLSVRDRSTPHSRSVGIEEPLADSSEKKRKRSSLNPMSPSKRSMSSSQPPKPASGENDLDTYQKIRQALIDAEVKGAWDYEASTNPRELAPEEKKAANILWHLREFERVYVFGNVASEALPGKDTLDMGGQFLTNKNRIEKRSMVFNVAKQVPKGALLHLHFNAELHPDRLIIEARAVPNMYVWSKNKITSKEDLDETEIMFKVLPGDLKDTNIFSDSYSGTAETRDKDGKLIKIIETHKLPNIAEQGWMRWSVFKVEFKRRFPAMYKQPRSDKLDDGNRTSSEPATVVLEPAEFWIKQKMVLSNEEAYHPAQTVNGVWARFNQATRCFKGLMNYERVYEWYIGMAIQRMIDEKVMYAELRPMLLDKTIQANNGDNSITLQDQMRMISEAVVKKKEQLDAKNEGDKFPFGLKIIYCTPRSIPPFMMDKEIDDCIALKEKFPDLICGFDLVGAEDRPNHIGYYEKQLVNLQKQCSEKNLEIPFLFHAGETLLDTGGSTNPQNSNLYDAVALRSKRIGHGFSLMKHPHLVEKFKRTTTRNAEGKVVVKNPGICIELCPISNELLHLCRNIKEHPYPELLAAGIPCCVNSDNPSLFSNSMSHEFYQVMVGSPTMSVHSWKQLALWSLEYSCLGAEQKTKAEEIFRKDWKKFCAQVVDDYGGLFEFEGDTVKTFHEGKAKEVYNKLEKKEEKKLGN